MNNQRRALAVLAACLLCVAAFVPVFTLARSPVKSTPADQPKATANPHGFAGNATCSGRGCHGAIGPVEGGDVAQNEFSTWARYDKHATAFDALRGPRAKDMATNLAPTNPESKAIPAVEDARCLACHSVPEYAAGTSSEMRALQRQGIGCETCHGPAQKGGDGWLTAHTTDAWKKLDAAGKEKLGMRALDAPLVQAQVCVGCHVGAPAKDGVPARDLNHDLMAAGHPRLIFELSSYQANMPPHWRTDKYKGKPGHDVSLWAAGRVESARASLDLLDSRAKDLEKPWPEFAEYGCFACHADLRPQDREWRYRTGYRDSKRPVGSLPYNAWFSTGLPELSKAVGDPSDVGSDFAKIAELMSKPLPDREAVANQARETRKTLTSLAQGVEKAKFNAAAARDLIKALAAASEKKLAALSWDATTQVVYALAVLYDATGAKRKEVTDQFAKIYGELAFPPRFESPAEFRSTGATRASDNLTEDLAALLKMLAAK